MFIDTESQPPLKIQVCRWFLLHFEYENHPIIYNDKFWMEHNNIAKIYCTSSVAIITTIHTAINILMQANVYLNIASPP